jgi:putative pyoverdin transport system ATP-binding/permease protein
MEFIKFLLQISWKQIVIATIAGLISGACNALLISVINREVHEGHFTNALLYFAILAIFILITSLISQFMLIYLTQNAIYELRLKLGNNILASPLQHLELLKENRLIVSFTEDVHTLTHAVAAVPNLCIDFATVIGCFTYLALFSSALFFFSITSTVCTIWFVQTKLNKAQSWFFQAREEEDTLLKHFQGIITGIKELKLNRSRREAFMEQNLQKSATKLRDRNTKAMKSFAIANGFGQLSQFISLGLILFILPLFLKIPVSMLATYVLIGTFIALPMQNLLNRIPELVRGNVALRKIQRMKLSLSSLSEYQNQLIINPLSNSPKIELKDITYRYLPELPPEGFKEGPPPFPPQGFKEGPPPFPPEGFPENGHPPFPPEGFPENGHPPFPPEGFPENGHPPFPPPHNGGGFMGRPRPDEEGFILGPINLTLQPGEILFIIGGNGSGKSTLAKIITGLYKPLSGEIALDGQPLTKDNLDWYRQHFSAIFSDFYLFESYLGFNYNDKLAAQIEDYLRKLHLAHKVQVKNGVLSTTNLSSGQRKRLALLTVLLEDRPIYLFDEWASDQQPSFRDWFYRQALKELKEKGKIVIVITHDDRYFDLADHTIKLDYGHIEYDRQRTVTT